jgi:hypothetical protein
MFKTRNFVLTPHDLGRVEHCPAAAVYVPIERDKPSFAQWHGIGMHKFMEYVATNGRDVALKYIRQKFPRMYKQCAAIDTDAIPANGMQEVQYVIDTAAGSCLIGDYADAEPDKHFYGRADIVWEDKDGWHVADYKTGAAIGILPGTSWQIKTLAAGMWMEAGRPDLVHGHIIVLPSMAWRDCVFSGEQMEKHAAYLRKVHLTVLETRAELRDEGIEPPFIKGEYCGYCDIRKTCPAHK